MGRVVAPLLLFIFFLFAAVDLDASSISYNDLTVDNDFTITEDNFSQLNLTVDGEILQYNDVTINYQNDDIINLSVNYNGVNYNLSASFTRYQNATTQAGLVRSLDIDDGFAVDNSNLNNIVCTVVSEQKEVLDVDVVKDSNEPGITAANLTCNSDYISSSSPINTINTNDNSVYKISNNDILYAEDFTYNLDKIDELTDEEILELSNAQSTVGNVIVSARNDTLITLASGDLNIEIEILEDEPPELIKEKYYNLSPNGDYNLNDIFNVEDDNDDEPNIEIDLDDNVGIYLKTITITDDSENEVEDEVLIIINDGRYLVSNSDSYIVDSSYNTFYNDKDNYLDVYNINTNSYENVKASFIVNTEPLADEISQSDTNKNQFTGTEKIDKSNINIFAILIMLLIFVLVVLV